MSIEQLRQTLENSDKKLSIPVDQCALALDILVLQIAQSNNIYEQARYTGKAHRLLNSIVAAVPESEPLYREQNNSIIVALLDTPLQQFAIL